MRIAFLCVGLLACATAPAPSPPEPAPTPPAAESKETVAPPATPPPEARPPEQPPPQAPKEVAEADQLLKDTIAMMLEMSTIMQGVVDEPTAKRAAPRLQELTHQAEALKIRLDIIKDSVSADQKEALKRKYEPQMMEAMNKLMQETKRVMQLPGASDALRGMRPR